MGQPERGIFGNSNNLEYNGVNDVTTRKIMIVEDEAIVAMQLEESLKQLGYEVVGVASRGNDAIRIAKDTWPDLILMDIRLEGSMDGIETAENINMFYNIPVIFLTAYSDDTTISRVVRTSSYGFMTKPFNERTLYSNIELAIGKHQTTQKSLVEETILSSIFELIPDVVISVSPDGMLRRMNAPARVYWDWDEDDVSAHQLFGILDAGVEDMGAFLGRLGNLEKSKMGLIRWPEHVVCTTGSGELHRFSLTVEAICGRNGELRELVLLLTPPVRGESDVIDAVTPRQVIDILSDPIFFTDCSMNLVLFNNAFQDFCMGMAFGMPALHRPVSDQVPAILAGEAERGHDLFRQGVAWQGVIEMKQGGAVIHYDITKVPIFDGELVSHMATILRKTGA